MYMKINNIIKWKEKICYFNGVDKPRQVFLVSTNCYDRTTSFHDYKYLILLPGVAKRYSGKQPDSLINVNRQGKDNTGKRVIFNTANFNETLIKNGGLPTIPESVSGLGSF